MALVTWGPELCIGVHAMDEQHKKLIAMLNDLHASMAAGKASETIGKIVSALLAYTQKHFQAEESLLGRYGYPMLKEHHARHLALSGSVEDYVKRFEEGERALSVHLLHFLRDWLIVHIQKEDRAYAGWLNAKGLR